MVARRSSILILAGALLVALIYHLWNLPSPSEEITRAERDRETMVNSYLALFEADTESDLDRFEKLIEGVWERHPVWVIGEAAALIYALENREELAKTKLDVMDRLGNTVPLRFALGFSDEEPSPEWQPEIEDWVDAKIAYLVYQRLERSEDEANALIRLRFFESRARYGYQIAIWDLFLRLFGMGLLLSMWLSARQWKRLGERFFRLDPLRLPLSRLLQFLGLYLFGFILLNMIIGFVLQGAPEWLSHSLFYLVQMAWAVFLLWKILFPMPEGVSKRRVPITQRLGIEDLRLRFSNIFQILGAFAILVFLRQLGLFFDTLLGWPDGPEIDAQAALIALFENPAAAGFYLMVSCILAPVFEEFIFRGLLFRGLLAHVHPVFAMLGSAFAFSVLHPIAYWPALFFMGMGLALIYYRSANLMICICVHALWNVVVLVLTLNGGLA